MTGSPRLAADVSAGGNLSIGRMDDGTVYGWGANGFSQLASGIAPGSLASPRRASALDGYRAAVTGFGHLCATTASPGTVRCQGNNFNGQIGDGTNTNRDTPTLVMSLSDATGLAAGDTHMCALRASGDVACWGRGLDGQLGDGAGASSNVPVRAALPAAASGVWAGTQHACARTDAGVYCWGANGSGQLGDGTRDATLVPVLASLPDAVSMALGNSHSCALAGNGSVRCWGANADGQLGDGTVTDRLGPAVVVPITP